MANKEENTGRGGARKGAGRKPTGRQKLFVSTTISGTAQEIAALKAAAEKAGKSVSRFILDNYTE